MQRRIYLANPPRIDFAMTDKNISAEAIGRAAGHSDGSYIRRMRKGERRALKATKQTAEAVSQMCGLPLDYLFTEVQLPQAGDVSLSQRSKTVGLEQQAS